MLHIRVTEHPTAGWIIQQLREAFVYDAVSRYLVFDNDKKYVTEVLAVIEHMGIRRRQITPHSPWRNGVAERWVQTLRRDLLDHVIVLNERHLHRLIRDFVAYYHDDRTHLGLGKSTPTMPRSSAIRGSAACSIATSGAKPPEGPTFGTLLAIPASGLVCWSDRGRTD